MFNRTIYFVFAIFFASCTSNVHTNGLTSNSIDTTGSPVETRKPVTDYQPAFPGQTRAPGIHTTTPYEVKLISTALSRPWGIATLPDGRFLITEKGGNMRLATTTGQLSEPITGLPPVNSGGQGGLLGLTLDPQFSNNKMVFWVFSEKLADGNLTSVAKGSLSADEKRIENATIIFRAAPAYPNTMHYGGRIIFDKQGNLFVSTGERFDKKTRVQAQEINSTYGKVLRITKDGKPAPGNPFINNANARPEVYSYGHRNVQGLAFHPETGDLWESEFGPLSGDELNIIKPGKNYGWGIISYGLEYNGSKVGEGITQQQGMEQPVYYWDPVLSPSGMIFYSGNTMQEWKNNLFICGLNSNHIARIVLRNNKVAGEERLLSSTGQRFRDITEGKDGGLYAITDEGSLFKIVKK